MSNRSVLREIMGLAGKLKPEGNKPFSNLVYDSAMIMLADYPPSDDRRDGLTNHERMLRNKERREALAEAKRKPQKGTSNDKD